jgi:hypothetical protein
MTIYIYIFNHDEPPSCRNLWDGTKWQLFSSLAAQFSRQKARSAWWQNGNLSISYLLRYYTPMYMYKGYRYILLLCIWYSLFWEEFTMTYIAIGMDPSPSPPPLPVSKIPWAGWQKEKPYKYEPTHSPVLGHHACIFHVCVWFGPEYAHDQTCVSIGAHHNYPSLPSGFNPATTSTVFYPYKL